MKQEFGMSNFKLMIYFRGIEVIQLNSTIFVLQRRYIMVVLKMFNIVNYKQKPTPTRINTSREDRGYNVEPTLFKILVSSITNLTPTRIDIM
jgi:hypothetical protein